ncbi:Protein kinase-like domain superfamily protein [Abortiporus biennis]
MNFFKRILGNRTILKKFVKYPEEPLDLSTTDGGGFYAASLGETLNSRYTIVRKLGWGQNSTVWLARDLQGNLPTYKAVKILSAYATEVQGHQANELSFLQCINDRSESSSIPGRKHVTRLLDTFEITDFHGTHLCLVFNAMGSLSKTFRSNLPVPLVKLVARQLLLALDFLHIECQTIHTDIKPDNLLVTLTIDQDIEELPTSHSKTKGILSQPIIPFASGDMIDTDLFNVQLTDFGTAAGFDGYHSDLIQPSALRAPEVIIGCQWDASADIWNTGCLIFELLTGAWLFDPQGSREWTSEEYHLGHMPIVTGDQFDLTYISKGKHFEQYFKPDGTLRLHVQGVLDLEAAVRTYEVLDDTEIPMFISFIHGMLRLKPSDRATAAELAQHEWLNLK